MLPHLHVRSVSLGTANDAIAGWHRHHPPTLGHKVSFGVYVGSQLVGVAVVGRPVSPHLQEQGWLEVTRLATDGTFNACSKLYAACRDWLRGYNRVLRRAGGEPHVGLITYIMASETGASLRAVGFAEDELRADSSARRGRKWSRKSGHQGGGVEGARARYSCRV